MRKTLATLIAVIAVSSLFADENANLFLNPSFAVENGKAPTNWDVSAPAFSILDGSIRLKLIRLRKDGNPPFLDNGVTQSCKGFGKGTYKVSMQVRGEQLERASFWFKFMRADGEPIYRSKSFKMEKQIPEWETLSFLFDVPSDIVAAKMVLGLSTNALIKDAVGFITQPELVKMNPR